MPFGKDEARAIFDFINRHQLYLEGTKNWFVGDFLRYLRNLRNKIVAELRKINVERVSELTKRTFTALLTKLDKLTTESLGPWSAEYLSELRRFARIDTTIQRAALAARTGADITSATINQVWNSVKDGAIPAFGKTVKETVTGAVAGARTRIQQLMRRSQADNLTVDETVAELDGEGAPKGYKGGVLAPVLAEAKSVITTTMQYISAGVTTFVSKIVSQCYLWVSIIDGVTSQVCRNRNGTVYRYGEGPVPPAHPNCRSRTVPWPCGEDGAVPTFNAWIRGQPRGLIRDVYGDEAETILDQSGEDVANFLRGRLAKSLTLDAFEAKTNMMVNGKA